jgi:hypothetical protein
MSWTPVKRGPYELRVRVGNVFVIGMGDGIGGNDCRRAADRRCRRDELRELGIDAEQFPNTDGNGEEGARCCRNNAETSAADLGVMA